MTRTGTEKFFADLQAIIESAEEMLHSTGGDIHEAREKTRDRLSEARQCMGKFEKELLAEAKAKARATSEYVHDNPWRSIAVAGGVAFVVGLLLGRRR